MVQILAVDDDPQVLRSIVRILQDAQYTVMTASSGQEALDSVSRRRPDLIILDVIMPEMDGLEVCRRLRADPFTAKLPVIFLTAKGRPGDIAQGLDTGGDDYLTKPFEVVELPARIRALLRRAPGGPLDAESEYLSVGELKLHQTRLEVMVGQQQIELTPVEHRLLSYLMLHAGQPMATERLLEDVWEYPPGTGNPKLVHVHVLNIRNKIEPDPDNPRYILNLHGRGYLVGS